MNVDDAIRDFGRAEDELPMAALRWALDCWSDAAPRFIALLERCVDGTDRSNPTLAALFFIIHLFGEKRETGAFSALCRLLDDGKLSERVLGDAITENLRDILVASWNGDLRPLNAVVESISADEFARSAALDTLACPTGPAPWTSEERA